MSAIEEERQKAALAERARKRGLQPWQLEMSETVDDATVRSIVNDFRTGPSQPSSIVKTDRVETPRVTSTQEPVPLDVPGLRWIDQQCDVADAIARKRRARELAGLEPDDAA
jgi:hypothetical protein